MQHGGTTDELIDAAEGEEKQSCGGAAAHRAGSTRRSALIASVSRTSSGRFSVKVLNLL